MTGTPQPSQSNIGGTVAERLRQLDCDPFEGMARIALDEKTPMETRWRILAALASYVAPKRKAVELTGRDSESLAVDLSAQIEVLSDDELHTMLSLLEKAGLRGHHG